MTLNSQEKLVCKVALHNMILACMYSPLKVTTFSEDFVSKIKLINEYLVFILKYFGCISECITPWPVTCHTHR